MDNILKTRIQHKRGTTVDWSNLSAFVPMNGELVIYTDHKVVELNGVITTYPGFKFGDGITPVNELPFVGDDVEQALTRELEDHINDKTIHHTIEVVDNTFVVDR